MRQQICILFMLMAFAPLQAGAGEAAPKPGHCPYALKPLPRNVPRAVDRIMEGMYPALKDKLLSTKRDDLVQFQTDWGSGIRNSLCLNAGGNDQLIRNACKGELCHPEDASLVIMGAVWDRLQSVQRVLRPMQD
jgi:hypothetical protein